MEIEKMKKIVSAMLCILIMASMIPSAFAYQVYSFGGIGPDDATSDWWSVHRDELTARRIIAYFP